MIEDIYNTIIYTDYTDLTPERQTSLFNEWLDCEPAKKRFFKFYKFSSFFMLIPLLPLLLSLVFSFYYGLSLVPIIFSIISFLLLIAYFVFSIKLDKVKKTHLIEYLKWLKVEKHVLADFKEQHKK